MESPVTAPLKVEFEQRWISPIGFPPPQVAEELARSAKKRMTIVRAVVVVVGAAGLAWATQRLGMPVVAGLCVFFAALPVLWLVGFFAGALLTVRSMAGAVREAALDRGPRDDLVEKIGLEVGEEALTVTRKRGTEAAQIEQAPWSAVHLNRPAPELAMLMLGAGQAIQVPASAFADAAAFDAFCLKVQERIWAAQRR